MGHGLILRERARAAHSILRRLVLIFRNRADRTLLLGAIPGTASISRACRTAVA
jgi:hypothetical protein